MIIESFAATADLIGRRIRLRWAFAAEPGESVAEAAPVTIRRKRRDFAFPALEPGPGPADPYLVHDSAAFPPAPVPNVLIVTDLPDRDWIEGPDRIREQTVSVAEVVSGQPREVQRHTVRTVFGADRAVLRREVELLDVGGLEPGVPYYYVLDSPALAGRSDVDSFRVTATAGEVHGHHRALYEMIPEVYRRHDTVARPVDEATGLLPEAGPAGGQLRRIVDVYGAALDSIRSSAEGLRGLRDVAEVDGRFLPGLAQWIGWDLSADRDIARQRNEIMTAPRLYDAVGTLPGLRSVVDYYTGWSTRVAEFAQHVARTGVAPQRNLFAATLRNGRWSGIDEAAPALGLVAPNALAAGADGVTAKLTGAAIEPFALRAGMTLTVAVDRSLPATITIGAADFADVRAARAAELAAVVNTAIGEVHASSAGGALTLESRLAGPASRIEVVTSAASLVSLDGAPRGRLSTVVDAEERVCIAHASATGAGGVQPRLRLKAFRYGRWHDTQQVEPQPIAGQADPALVAVPGGRLWMAWAEHHGTAGGRLRWRYGTPRAATPARLRGTAVTPFRLTVGGRLTLTGFGGSQTFTVRAADYADPPAARAEEVVAAINAQLTAVSAAVAADGSLALHTTATGPDVVLRVDLAASTAAWPLGLGDRQLTGRGGWEPDVDWEPAAEIPTVPTGRQSDCTAVLDPEGAVRLFWSTHAGNAWRIARARFDGRLVAATGAGVAMLAEDGSWTAVTTAGGLPSNDVRGVTADADGSTWYATAAGGAVRRPDGTITSFTTANTGGRLGSDDVRCVAVARDGATWFGHAAGASLRRTDGSWLNFTATAVRHIAVDDRYEWFATASGISRRDSDGELRVVDSTAGLPSDDVRRLAAAPDGSLWAATAAGAARISADGTISAVDLIPAGAPGNDVRAVAVAPPPAAHEADAGRIGTVWLAAAGGVAEVRTLRDVRWHPASEGLPSADVRTVQIGPGDSVWAGTAAGVARRGPAGDWTRPAGGPAAAQIRDLHGPWSPPSWFPLDRADEREPFVLRDGNVLRLVTAVRAPSTATVTSDDQNLSDTWLIAVRRFTFPGPQWSSASPVTSATGAAPVCDREPVLLRRSAGTARVYLRSDRGGGPRLWSVDLDGADQPGAPAVVSTTVAADSNPAALTMPDGSACLLFRSDRNVALGRLGGGVPGSVETTASRRAPEEASVRRYAGSITAMPADLDRNRGRFRFGDLLDYTPQQPGGGPLTPDEVYTPGTIGLYVERGPSGRPLVRRDADRLRQLLDRFLPVNLRAVVVLRSEEIEELVFPPGHLLTDTYRDDYQLVETYAGPAEETAVALPGWLVFLISDGTSVTVDPGQPTTLRRRSWWPPFR